MKKENLQPKEYLNNITLNLRGFLQKILSQNISTILWGFMWNNFRSKIQVDLNDNLQFEVIHNMYMYEKIGRYKDL